MPARKDREQQLARELRARRGLPFKRIAALLGVSVSSAYSWTRDIEITVEQRHRNLYGPDGPFNSERVAARVSSWKERAREKRRRWQEEGREAARATNPLHVAGCMLYWAEGSKARNAVQLANSDPSLVGFFRGFLQRCFGVASDEFKVALNVYLNNGLEIVEIEDFWLDKLDLPRCCLRSHSINALPTSSSGRKRNKLPYGVCRLTVHSTRIVQHIYGAIQEYGGFDEPRWLDC
jgi:hypothetical protein